MLNELAARLEVTGLFVIYCLTNLHSIKRIWHIRHQRYPSTGHLYK